MAYLAKYKPELATEIKSGLEASFAALDVCLQGCPFVLIASSGTQQELDNVENAMNAINGLNTVLNEAKDWIIAN